MTTTNETKRINTEIFEFSAVQVRTLQLKRKNTQEEAVFNAEKREFYACLKTAIELDEEQYEFQREFSSLMKRFLTEKGFDLYERLDSRNQVITVVSWDK